jgi:hypothetical protein
MWEKGGEEINTKWIQERKKENEGSIYERNHSPFTTTDFNTRRLNYIKVVRV